MRNTNLTQTPVLTLDNRHFSHLLVLSNTLQRNPQLTTTMLIGAFAWVLTVAVLRPSLSFLPDFYIKMTESRLDHATRKFKEQGCQYLIASGCGTLPGMGNFYDCLERKTKCDQWVGVIREESRGRFWGDEGWSLSLCCDTHKVLTHSTGTQSEKVGMGFGYYGVDRIRNLVSDVSYVPKQY